MEVPALPTIENARIPTDLDPDPQVLEIDLVAAETTLEFIAGKPAKALAFNGQSPGPTLYARVGDRVKVHFKNDLDEPTTIHWHGLRIEDSMDGAPRVQDPVPPGGTFEYEFTLPDAGTFWYHPHANTVEQIERGLQGTIVVAGPEEPQFSQERLFVLDDIRLRGNGTIAPFADAGMDIMHGRLGDTLLQDGRAEPLAGTIASGAIERWRIVNTSGARNMKLSLKGASWKVIGTDGGLLPDAWKKSRVEMTVGQRFDFEVRVDQGSTEPVQLISHVPTVQGDQVVDVPMVIGEYAIEGTVTPSEPEYPSVALPPTDVEAEVQEITLGAYATETEVVFTVNGMDGMHMEDLEFPQGKPVRLILKNEIGPYHPFHLHGQFFQILKRGNSIVKEPGLKDTVLLNGMETVEILTYFDNPGLWMYHCHIAEHAEHGMMAHLRVTPSP